MVILLLLLTAEALTAFLLLKSTGRLKTAKGMTVSAALIVLAFFIRFLCFDYKSGDYLSFLANWVNFYRVNGGFAAVSKQIPGCNYNMPYMYFLALFSCADFSDLYLIKLLSCFFDVLTAYAVMELCALLTVSDKKPVVAFFAVLFLPTVVINSALWGQCDSIYVSLALLGVLFALRNRPIASVALMGISFAFKLQAVFILPVIAVLWMYGKYRFRHFFVFPLSYILAELPAVILGKPFMETISFYLDFASTAGGDLSNMSPSIFAYIATTGLSENPESPINLLLGKLGIAAAFLFMLTVIALCFINRKKLSDRSVLLALLLFVIGIPFLLPHMHDRYFYSADVLSVAFALLIPELALLIAVPTEFASLIVYVSALTGMSAINQRTACDFMFISLAFSVVMFIFSLYPGAFSTVIGRFSSVFYKDPSLK